MKSYVLLVALIVMGCQSNQNALMKDVQSILKGAKGEFGVAFKDLATGETFLINEHELFHAASTMKTPVMIEVFKQAEEGNFSVSDSLTIKNEFKSIVDGSTFSLTPADDGEQELYKHLGEKRTIDQLVYDMIIVSSNLATNMIIELVDAKNVTQSMRDIGANNIQVLRGVEDGKAFDKGMNNVTTAYDLMLLFEKIARGEVVNKEMSSKMEQILLDQKFNEIIPAHLPKNVRVAHKTGNITGVRHDSGIVILPDGKKYVLILLSKELEDENQGIKVMADVSKRIYDHVTAHR